MTRTTLSADVVGSADPVAPSSEPHPLAWRLIGKRIVVVGGGEIGTAKIETLLDSGAEIVVVDPEPSNRARDLARQGRVRLVERRARPTDLVRARLIVAATGRPSTNRRIRRWAKPFGAVVNAVDDQRCQVVLSTG